jgi:hypothetical protein
MQYIFRSMRILPFSLLMILALSLLFGFSSLAVSRPGTPSSVHPSAVQNRTKPLPVSGSHAFINYRNNGEVGCRDATQAEAQHLKRRSSQAMHEISLNRLKGNQSLETQSTGLQIILRGTDQLENYPAAKAAFLNAAARWEALINTPITVIVDVDFGTTWFGERYDTDVLGQTDSQDLGDNSIYGEVRDTLVGRSALTVQSALYNQLPLSSVPTDLGSTSYLIAPSALWRALGFINPVADPSTEQNDLGDPPATGFNSVFDYDFDPSDGISANTIDFDSVATHEIGHVLGFDSNTGYKELVRSAPVAVTIWDLFRFRPGTTFDSFATAQRILSSGGNQNFFDGTQELALSTGRPDGTGGDREQASHWKDDRLTGQFIGIMDPTLADGMRETISDKDLAALKSFGYAVNANATSGDSPTITEVIFNGGKKLKIIGTGFSGDISIEVNSHLITSPISLLVNETGKKIQLKAAQSDLNIQSGSNQVQVIRNGVRSNAFTFTF